MCKLVVLSYYYYCCCQGPSEVHVFDFGISKCFVYPEKKDDLS